MPPKGSKRETKKKAEQEAECSSNQPTSNGQAARAPTASVDDPSDTAVEIPAGQPSVSSPPGQPESEEEFNSKLHSRIVKALCDPEVIKIVTKAVSEAIMDTVTQRVYSSLDHDFQTKLKLIHDLEKSVSNLERKLAKVETDVKDQELYSRRNCLRINGLAESANEDTDTVVINLAKDKLGIQLSPGDIDRSHRLPVRTNAGNDDDQPRLPKPLLVKFTRYSMRDRVYRARSKLQENARHIFINEHLSRDRQMLFFKVRNHHSIKKAWTNDFKITALTKDNRKVKITTENDLDRL